ncbi:hypothetical protein C8R45DRAFT_1215056 [Mycena sanguinolenta]|nr:hypothetical protein C8R45DRAFT_1215056 [Mycena sanguinolenta]
MSVDGVGGSGDRNGIGWRTAASSRCGSVCSQLPSATTLCVTNGDASRASTALGTYAEGHAEGHGRGIGKGRVDADLARERPQCVSCPYRWRRGRFAIEGRSGEQRADRGADDGPRRKGGGVAEVCGAGAGAGGGSGSGARAECVLARLGSAHSQSRVLAQSRVLPPPPRPPAASVPTPPPTPTPGAPAAPTRLDDERDGADGELARAAYCSTSEACGASKACGTSEAGGVGVEGE